MCKKGIVGKIKVVEVDKFSHGYLPTIFIDEASEWPIYKWWHNPIKWYKNYKLWKKILKIPKFDTYRLSDNKINRSKK